MQFVAIVMVAFTLRVGLMMLRDFRYQRRKAAAVSLKKAALDKLRKPIGNAAKSPDHSQS